MASLTNFEYQGWTVDYQTNTISSAEQTFVLEVEPESASPGEIDDAIRSFISELKEKSFSGADYKTDGSLTLYAKDGSAPEVKNLTNRNIAGTQVVTIWEKAGGILPPPQVERAQSPPLPVDINEVQIVGKCLGGAASDARLGTYGNNQKVVRKRPSAVGGPAHLKSENTVNKLLRLMGKHLDLHGFPKTEIYNTARSDQQGNLHGSQPVLLSGFIEGTILSEYLAVRTISSDEKQKMINQARQYFALDALFSNKDSVGLDLDNMLVGKDGIVYRIDNGGTMSFTALGKPMGKYWGEEVGEYKMFTSTTNDKVISQFYMGYGLFEGYGRISDPEILDQTQKMLDFFIDENRSKQFFDILEHDPQDAKVLKARLVWIINNKIPSNLRGKYDVIRQRFATI
jgi:hypothetical protein